MIVYSDELCHWAKGSVGKNHKYVKREWKKGKWVYTYPKNSSPSISERIGIKQRRELKAHEKMAKPYGGVSNMYDRQQSQYDRMVSEWQKSKEIEQDIKNLDPSNPVDLVKKLVKKRDYEGAKFKSQLAENELKETTDWVVKHYALQRRYDATWLGHASDSINRAKSWLSQRIG